MSKRITITIDVDLRCLKCRKKGAQPSNGLCLKCAGDLVIAKIKREVDNG